MKQKEKDKIVDHINKDDKEFRKQIQEDKTLKKSLKVTKKK
jgi:hypothetical protein